MEGMNRIVLLLLALLGFSAAAQEEGSGEPLPRGFRDLQLGLSLEAAREILRGESNFLFRGEPDVSLLARPNESLIDSRGAGYIERGIFQFHEKVLYSITLIFDPETMDFSTVFAALTEKYGPFLSLDPRAVRWEDEEVRLFLEKPCTLKYLYWPTFEKIRRQAVREESLTALNKAEFLDQL